VSHLNIETAEVEHKLQEASLLLEKFMYGYSVYHFIC